MRPRCSRRPTTRAGPSAEALDGATPAGAAARPELLAHGTTVATNALLERRGAAVALVTTEGLADVIEIARQDRPSLYDQLRRPARAAGARARWRYEVAGRLAADGSELAPRRPGVRLPDIDPDVEAVAVCLLHADLDPAHERAVAERAARPGPRRDLLARGVARRSASTSAR